MMWRQLAIIAVGFFVGGSVLVTLPHEQAFADNTRFSKLVKEAKAARQAGDLERTADLVKQAYGIKPLPVLMNNLGKVYEEMGRIEEAIACYEKVVNNPKADKKLRDMDRARIAALKRMKTAKTGFDGAYEMEGGLMKLRSSGSDVTGSFTMDGISVGIRGQLRGDTLHGVMSAEGESMPFQARLIQNQIELVSDDGTRLLLNRVGAAVTGKATTKKDLGWDDVDDAELDPNGRGDNDFGTMDEDGMAAIRADKARMNQGGMGQGGMGQGGMGQGGMGQGGMGQGGMGQGGMGQGGMGQGGMGQGGGGKGLGGLRSKIKSSARPSRGKRVTLKYNGYSFKLPRGWVSREKNGVYMIGHNTKPGFILVTQHTARSLNQMANEAPKGLEVQEGVTFQLRGQPRGFMKNGMVAEFAGQTPKGPGFAYTASLLSPHGGGVTIILALLQSQRTPEYIELVHSIAKSARFFKAKQRPANRQWTNRLMNTRLKYMWSHYSGGSGGSYAAGSQTTIIDICRGGYFNFSNSGSISADSGSMNSAGYDTGNSASGYSGGQQRGNGNWRIFDRGGQAVLQLNFHNGEVSEYTLSMDGTKTMLDGKRYFRQGMNAEPNYRPNCN